MNLVLRSVMCQTNTYNVTTCMKFSGIRTFSGGFEL